MKKFKAILLAVLMGMTFALSALAQKGNDNRPPKEQPKVVDKEKGQKPPPQNSNSNRKKP